MKVKIAVYAICKDEAATVSRWVENLAEADGIFVTDTGSTDGSIGLLEQCGARVTRSEVKPWRFDVARNVALGAVPAEFDVCFSIDLDEVVTPGWRDEIERIWRSDVDRVRYQYIWSRLDDGRDGVTFWHDRIHRRHGFKWVKPVHEILKLEEARNETHVYSNAITLRHYPDARKSRSGYRELLELACREDPEDDRSCHYLGRDYLHLGLYNKAILQLELHLSLRSATWKPERAASMRYIAIAHRAMGNLADAQSWALRACAEAPGEREPWVDLGTIMYAQRNYHGAYFAMKQALAIAEKPSSYICEPQSWGSYPYDVASLAAYYLGLRQESVALCERGLALDPHSERLRNNLEFLTSNVNRVAVPEVEASRRQPQRR
jgi:glycosyltransferase involved in cell wall biosynthesis